MKQKILALTTAVVLSAAPLVAQATTATINDIQKGASALVDTLVTGIPFNSTIGLNWSDAYIGPFLAIPPNFGVGVTAGATTIDGKEVANLLEKFGVSVSSDIAKTLPLPAGMAEARIGGFFLPFDLGFKAGFIPASVADSLADSADGLKADYLLVGGDIRYSVLKGSLLLPKISVGVGFNYMKGGVSKELGDPASYTYDATDYNNTQYRLGATAPDVGLTWESKVIDLKVQVSKSLIIFTPYVGLGASYGMTTAGYSIDSNVTYEKNVNNGGWGPATTADIEDLKQALAYEGIEVPDLSTTGISYESDGNGWGLRAFGGLSVNLLILRLDVTGLYNFSDGNLGASVGARIQF